MDIRDFLSRLHVEAGPNGSGEYMCRCPAHDDKTASLCVRDGEKGIVLKCQAGCDTEAVVTAMGLKMRDLFREASASVGKVPQPASAPPAKKGGGKKPRGKFVCAYSYTDESGKVLFEAGRYQRDGGSKTFSLRQPDPSRPDGYKYTKEGARLVLYKLPQVLAAIKAGKPVFVVEGEKDCDNMELMGYTATTNPMGAGKWLAGDYSNSLTGADLYIIPDNDDVGRNHAKQVAQSTYKLAKSVRMVELTKVCSELPPKGDVTDMYKLLGRKAGDAALKQAMQAAEPFTGDALAQRDAAAEYYNRVYGYYDAMSASIRHRSSDSRRLDGLNPHMAIFDEIHEYRDFKLINIIKRKIVKRTQPLVIYITTMGNVIDGPLAYFYDLFTDAMSGKLAEDVADRMFAFIAELDEHDDPEDDSTWIKANPSLGVLLKIEDLRETWERDKHIPAQRADFLCKQLNITVNTDDMAFVQPEVLGRNDGTIEEEALLGRRCYGGFDLSSREDFTAAALEFPLDDGRVFVLLHSWVPRRKVELDQEKIDYYGLAMKGYLTIVDGEYIQQEDVYSWFCEQAKKYEIMTIGYRLNTGMMHDGNLSMMPKGEKFSLGFTQ